MKKYLCLCAAILAMTVSMTFADEEIEGVQIAISQTLGVNAAFNAGAGTIHWSGGLDGLLMTENYDVAFYSTNTDTISADFSIMTDLTSGGPAKASFASGLWSIIINVEGYANPVAEISGHLAGSYNEMATNEDGTALEGRAVAIVDAASFNNAYWQTLIPTPVYWEGIGMAAGIIADISLPEGQGIDDYQSNYITPNVVVTLYADESVVPEPATIALLTLGGLLLRKRG